MKHYDITVIIPIYNVANYIERCVRSLFEQTKDNVQYVFVDDASPDNSVEIIENVKTEYCNRKSDCVFLRHSINRGVAAARNTGLRCALGRYIIYCDGDDWMDVNMLEVMYDAAELKKADIVSCNFISVLKDRKEHHDLPDWNSLTPPQLLQAYIEYPWNVLWNLLVRRELYEENNLSSPEGISYCEDFSLTVKLFFFARKIININQYLYYYNRVNVLSALNTFQEKYIQDERLVSLDLVEFFKRNGTYQYYKKQMSWRVLKSKRNFLLDKRYYKDFLAVMPESNAYICSCPYLTTISKLMGWLLVHHCAFLSYNLLKIKQMCACLRKKRQ